ncbi:MAG: outer membrane beta-barrel protein [Burkholderiales bacterium]
MKRTAILIAALAGALLVSHAQAQEPGQVYFGIGYGSATTDGASPYGDTLDEDTAGGFKVYGGSMREHFGIEVGFYNLGKYDVNLGGAKIAETKTAAVAVSGVLATPLGGGYSFHAKLGLAFTQAEFTCISLCGTGNPVLADTEKRGISGLLGVGLGARLGRNVLVRIDYEHFGNVHHQISTTEYTDAYDLLSFSLQFNF